MEHRYMVIESKLCKELDLLQEKYRTGAEMSEGDLRRIDLLAHSLKSLVCYMEKKGSDEWQGESFNSYNNGNSYMNNSTAMRGMRSRDIAPDMSGHYPMNYPVYPEERRW